MSQIPGDGAMMALALRAGEAVKGRTGDNPWVGCVVSRGDSVVALGATHPPGGAHAEVEAITLADQAGVNWAECTLYVTVEPCTFHGRTPPCVDLVLEKKPSRVVVGILDPHPRVKGQGVARLRQAGIPVELGVLEKEVTDSLADWLAGYIK
ncbi:MAG: bifunctional diaminohydroxyphosphoribosylaminopyrimidine deaminase/5-amino-6-(5-phosphoribosylamino)uracil reductase RibD [Deltaproteobacteria bacterium]|nr:bifunctional diaminohydroxyphosphoribosylaminopyrimidine deaminase/5-amino-6-(5-phosphoribosylamino)uracil reductase RibD [Deltaproteobacteria bacterium]